MNVCPACRGSLTSQRGRDLFDRCRRCGALVRRVLPDEDEHRRRHDDLYFAEGDRVEMTPSVLLEQYLDFVERRHPLAGADVLDIGSGTAPTAELVQTRGGRYVGLEASEPARRELASRGIEAVADLDDVPADRAFDVVLMIELIEHLPDPHPVLADVRDRIAEGGHLLVVTPDADSLKSRLQRDRWEQAQNPTHVVLYGHAGLTRLLAATGFQVVDDQRRLRHGRGPVHVGVQTVLQTFGLDSGLRLLAAPR